MKHLSNGLLQIRWLKFCLNHYNDDDGEEGDDGDDDDADDDDDNDKGNLQGEYFIKIGRRCHWVGWLVVQMVAWPWL